MVGKTNRGWSEMGLGQWSHGNYLFIIGPMGTFVSFAVGCLGGEVQTTNVLSVKLLIHYCEVKKVDSSLMVIEVLLLVIPVSKNRSVCR